jgi:hypothetical protein
VPEQHRAEFDKLKGLNQTEVNRLLAALETLDELNTASIESLLETNGTKKEDVRELASLVRSLYMARAISDVAIDKFVATVCRGMESIDAAFGEQSFRDRLKLLLGNSSLALKAKALTLQTDHGQTFCHARIYTDLRHAFPSDPKEAPLGYVLIHMLKLSVHTDGEHKDVYVALDDSDLEELQASIDRAKDKSKTLKETMRKSGAINLTDS